MVRKKIKKAPEASEHFNVDLNNIVASWLKALDLPDHKSVPSIPQNVDVFSMLQSPQVSSDQSVFTQARGLQALRAAVARGTASPGKVRFILLSSLLLFIDPDTSTLRKSVKGLLCAAENSTPGAHGSETEEMVEIVAARFLEHFRRVMISSTSPPQGLTQQRTEEDTALRMVVSLRWFAEVPAGKRALLIAQDGGVLIGCIAVLGEALDLQASAIKKWHGRGGGVARRALVAELEGVGGEEQGGVEAADLSAALDACSEVLKTAAALMSLTTEWDVRRLPQGDITARRLCSLCLLVLSTPTVQREAATHASAVLVHVATASWRGSGQCPPTSTASDTTRTTTSDEDTTNTPPSARRKKEAPSHLTKAAASVACELEEVSSQLTKGAAKTICESFFFGHEADRGHDGADADGTRALLASFLPLPPGSSIAVCRALLHIVDPSVLLVRADIGSWTKGGGGGGGIVGKVGTDNLLLGPILTTILARCGSESGLQLRFLALQVLEAWCSKAAAFAQSGLSLQSGFPVTSVNDSHHGDRGDLAQTLSRVMGVATQALVHPAKLISSLAPSLLEHVVNLRHSILEVREGCESGDASEWKRLAERVLQQPATFKGKYVALGVLLPRLGALRLLELCPSLVEQLVWAVGVRGNVSGQATTLLLQFLTAISTEVERSSTGALSPTTESGAALNASGGEKAGNKIRDTSPVASKARCDAKVPARRGKATASTHKAASLCRKWWLGPAAAALMQEDSWARSHVAAYLLPEVFKFDPASAAPLSAAVQEHVCEHGDTRCDPPLLGDAGGSFSNDVRRMWAKIEVARFARKCGATTGLTLANNGTHSGEHGASAGLLVAEVRWASLHVDETLRMSALSLLCTDLRMTTVPPPAETDLIREVLPYSLKVFGAQSRQLLLRAVQTLLLRMRETVRVCVKELSRKSTGAAPHHDRGADSFQVNGSKRRKQKQDKGAQHGSGSAARGSGSSHAAVGEKGGETAAQMVERVEVFVRWLGEEVLRSLYPGCPFEREVLGLEMVQLVLSELMPAGGSQGADQRENALAKVVSSSIFRRRWVDTLLALLGSSWDRTRSLAYSVLARFPRPLAGYEGVEGATRLAAEGLRLSGSGRQQESDRGALILRLVYVSHARGLGLDVPLFAAEIGDSAGDGRGGVGKGGEALGGVNVRDGDAGVEEQGGGDAAVRFLEGLRVVLSHRLDTLQRVWDDRLQRQADVAVLDAADTLVPPAGNPLPVEANTTLLPHGVLLAVHHVLLDSELPKGGRAAKGRHGRRTTPRSTPVMTDGAVINNATNTADSLKVVVEDTVQLEQRRQVVGALLKQAFRALRLALLIVGEHSGGGICGEGGEEVLDEHFASCGGEGTGQPGGGDATAQGTRSARSVNANGHVGMVLVDSHGHAVSPPLVSRPGESVACDDAVRRVEVKPGAGRSVVEGQRAVVGAWLLAKEACRCLATMVTASPLPAAQAQTGTTSSNPDPNVDAGDGAGVSASVVDAGSAGSLLTDEDVTKVGDTLLESLLSLKHMGCVASAQAAFQAVNEALLHGRRRNPSLMCLPSVWLDKLLRQLDGSKKEFVLRRSTGLALAFVSILRAEPRSVEPVLLPRCMRHLLALAHPGGCEVAGMARAPVSSAGPGEGPGTTGDWKSTVHALNVLRVVFVDATLADDVGPYVTQATMAAVCGFEAPTWAVRNSSMMVFASIMQRAVGGAKNSGPADPYSDGAKRPHSARDAITAEAFFQQHSKLHPFLLSQLKRAADHASRDNAVASPSVNPGAVSGQEGKAAVAAATSRAEMHPVLYPILLLLARLRASGGEAETGAEQNEGGDNVAVAGLSTAAFVPLVTQCASNPHYLARAASSRALAALVPPARSSGVISKLLEGLPKDATDGQCLRPGAYNHIHGTLLQVTELLMAARASQGGDQLSETNEPIPGEDASMNPSQADERPSAFLENVAMTEAAAVLDLVWLADPSRSPCPPIRHAMLNVLQVLAEFGGGSVAKVQSALQTAREDNFSHAVRTGSGGRVVPGRSVLVAAVVGAGVRSRLGRALVGEADRVGGSCSGGEGTETSPAEEVEFAVSLLTSDDMDVRDAAIKATKKFFGPGRDRKAGGVSQEVSLLVWAAAAHALMAEVHPPNVRRLVRLLARVGLCLRRSSLSDPAGLLWDHLRRLCGDGQAGGSEEVHAGALEVMGVIVRLGKSVADGESRPSVDFDEYAGLLECAADAFQPVSTRAASAASLASSRLLAMSSPGHVDSRGGPGACGVGAFVRLWFVALSLLQDDDERVRICAAQACADTADSSSSEKDVSGGGKWGSLRGGGRVGIFAVDRALARLSGLAEDPDGRAAEHFALNLLRVLAVTSEAGGENIPATLNDEVNVGAVTDAGVGGGGFGGGDVDEDVGEASEDGEMIFGREERNRFQEPGLFACVAAPYLLRALVALDARDQPLPASVMQGMAGVLHGLAEKLESLRDSASATWLPAVFRGIISASAAGGAVLEFMASRHDRKHNGGDVDLLRQVARAVKACEGFEAVLGRNESVHPEVSRGVGLALRAARR